MLPKKKPLRRLQPKRPGGTRPEGISEDLLKKIKNILDREKKIPDMKRKIGGLMSPGQIKAITGKTPGQKTTVRKPDFEQFKKRRKMVPMTGGVKGIMGVAGKGLSKAGGVAMSKAALNAARKLKPSGRISPSDMKRARDMLKKRKGK